MIEYDVVIIGSGLYGIAAARCFLEIHPDRDLIILESEASIGGTWSKDRVYDDFWTQTPLGMAEFSDIPLEVPLEDQIHLGFFPARYITKYLEEYLDGHSYGGKTLRDRVLLGHKVTSAVKDASKWKVLCGASEEIFITRRLVVATGLTSKPHQPLLPNRDAFIGEVLHHRDFGQSSLLNNPRVVNIAVLGGGKSAADVVYACAKAGKSVSWILRENGCGPAAHGRAQGRGPYTNSISMFNTRFISSFSPSVFAPLSAWSWLLHGTNLGRKFVDWVWESADRQNRSHAGYQTRQGAGSGFEKLEPDTPVFWQNDGSGIDQRPDFWEVVAEKVNVFRSNITNLSETTIRLRDGSVLAADVLICATGWESALSFLNPQESARLGLPVLRKQERPEDAAKWSRLESAARDNILRRFPSLADPPVHFAREMATTPYRLYKGIAPLDDRTIVILGHIQVGNNFMAAECQALWATAYFDERLHLPSQIAMANEVALSNVWCRLRYLGKGQMGIWYYFDLVPYIDMLLADIKLRSYRRSWALDLFSPVTAKDIRRLHQEYVGCQGRGVRI
ncbi:putative dimethylaniline monooxygenase [Calycina marina]|uniref:Dimethylaniline monooxygenase n=1 Tax=Calycina marina TaxID=1763456 RepID=A0A9P8CCB0_9HELO|nr:putative dimethylaniline monooxygenase [Calycina marina]